MQLVCEESVSVSVRVRVMGMSMHGENRGGKSECGVGVRAGR